MTTHLDNLLRDHSIAHRTGTDNKHDCSAMHAAVKAEIVRLCPHVTAREVDTLFWLAKGGLKNLTDMYIDAQQLYHVAAFLPAADVCEAIKSNLVRYEADSEYVTKALKEAGVEHYNMLQVLKNGDDDERSLFLDLFTLEKSKLAPGGEMTAKVHELTSQVEEIISRKAIDHTDGGFTAFTLISLWAYSEEVQNVAELGSKAIKWIINKHFAQVMLDFVTATHKASDEGEDLKRRYPNDEFYQLRNDELGLEARKLTLLPLQYAADHGGLEGFDLGPLQAFAAKHQKNESPLAKFLRESGMPADIIAIFEA